LALTAVLVQLADELEKVADRVADVSRAYP
jgi:hypothetical protein